MYCGPCLTSLSLAGRGSDVGTSALLYRDYIHEALGISGVTHTHTHTEARGGASERGIAYEHQEQEHQAHARY